jgi:general secretion pathway protein G
VTTMFKSHFFRLLDTLDKRQKDATTRLQRGMTLVEVMVVIVIISLVASVVGVSVFGQLKRAQVKLAYTQIKQISDALELYKLATRRFPSTGEGLQALVQGKGNDEAFMKSIPEDPWGNAYVYIYPGTSSPNSFDLMSYGPDGVAGGGDDITNWQTPDAEKQP